MNEKALPVRNLFNIISVTGLLLIIAMAVYGWRIGIFTSMDELRRLVQSTGMWGPVVFIIVQIIQVVIPIIPGGISCLAGVVLFGPVEGFVYNYVGISIGSVIAFELSRRLGKPFLQSLASKKMFDKYIGWLDKENRFDKMFAIAIFLPVAPDDFLCMLAGLTKMKLKKFITIILLGKPASIIAYSFGLSTLATWLVEAAT